MNLLSTLNKNTILTGPVDSYCLVCDRLLRGEDECVSHIYIPLHQKNLTAAPILDKYKDDNIVKVKLGYYCIYCNTFLKTVTKVGLHINENSHKHLKSIRSLRWDKGVILAFNEVQIQEYAWHGLTENTCLICNTDVVSDCLEVHMEDKNHVFELIKNKCVFGDNYIYRLVDEDAFFCVICAKVFGDGERSDHHISNDHKNNYIAGKQLAKVSLNEKGRVDPTMNKNVTEKTKVETTVSKFDTKCGKVDTNIKNTFDDTIIISKKVTEKPKVDTTVSKVETKFEKANHIKSANTGDERTAKTIKPVEKDIVDTHIVKSEIIESEAKVRDSNKNTYFGSLVKNKQLPPQGQNVNNSQNVKDVKNGPNVKDGSSPNINVSQNDADEFFESSKNSIYEIAQTHGFNPVSEDRRFLDSNFIMKTEFWSHCLICNDNLNNGDIQKHLKDESHLKKLAEHKKNVYVKVKGDTKNTKQTTETPNAPSKPCKEDKTAVPSDPPKTEGKNKKREQRAEQETHSKDTHVHNEKSNIKNEYDKFKKNDINIDFDTEIVYCKRCDEDLEYNCDSIEKHLKEAHEKPFTGQDLDAEIIQFGYENYMHIIEGKAFCKLCEEDVNTNLDDMKDHVNFYIHKDIVVAKTGSGPLTKTSGKEFFNTLVCVESALVIEVIINNSYVVTLKSFHTTVGENREISCALCDEELKQRNGDVFMQHIATSEHKELLAGCNVVTSMQNEFLRELRPGVYHCGYCNVSFASWFLTVSHTSTPAHRAARRHALWSLERTRTVARNARPVQISNMDQVTIA